MKETFELSDFTKRVLLVLDGLKESKKVNSDRQFAFSVGIDPTQISFARKQKRDIPEKYLFDISEKYAINRDFLKSGYGEIYTNNDNVNLSKEIGFDLNDKAPVNHGLSYTENSTFPNRSKSNQDEAPYLENVNASAGLNFLTNNGDATSYIKIPGAGVDAYINVFGDSMYPKYCAGEIIGVKQVQKDDLFFGHAFVVQMSDGEAYIKYIQPGKDEDHWSLESENPKYPPRQFHLSKINKIFKIKTTVTKNSL